MAIKEMLMPELAESVVEGEILKWLVEEGQEVALDQPLVEVMTDKVTVELPAPFAGKLFKKMAQEGEIVAVHKPLAQLEVGGAAAPETHASPETYAPETAKTAALELVGGVSVDPNVSAVGTVSEAPQMAMNFGSAKGGAAKSAAAKAGTNKFGRALATPSARQAAREADVEILEVPGSGPNGRVNTADVQAYVEGGGTAAAPVAAPVAVAANVDSSVGSNMALGVPAAQYKTPKGYEAKEERSPLRGMRKAISRAMVASHLHTVRTLTVDEADLTELVALRGRLKAGAEKQGVKLTYLPFFVKAVAAALKKFPNINSSIDEASQEIVRKKYYNIGIAVDTEAGLLVPVVRDVDSKSMLEIATSITDLAGKARVGKLSPEDSSGGTFSITNMGSAGSLISFPIINAPEAAILGIHTIVERPVGRGGNIELRSMMYLSLSFDHRLIDGAEAARFVREICRLLENPETLLLEAI